MRAEGRASNRRVDASAGEQGAVPPRQERLLSEISHELGNYFHKLYYWAELLREQRPSGADAEPATLLERTIRDLEGFLKSTLEYFRPIKVVPVPMAAGDVVRSVRSVVARHVEPGPLAWQAPELVPGTLGIDPGRFSFVLEGMVRRLRLAEAAPVGAIVGIEQGGAALAISLTARGPEAPVTDGVRAALEWAIVERVVEAHGGVVEAVPDGAERQVCLHLPIAS